MQDWQPGYLSLKICSIVQGAPCTLQLTVNIGKCNCEGLHINECKLQHVLYSQVFDYSMSCANTTVIPPCTNKVIHIYVYRFQDVPSYWIGSNLKLNRTKTILSKAKKTTNRKLREDFIWPWDQRNSYNEDWPYRVICLMKFLVNIFYKMYQYYVLNFLASPRMSDFLFVNIGPGCMCWAIQHDTPKPLYPN